jgi:hypothetical protein
MASSLLTPNLPLFPIYHLLVLLMELLLIIASKIPIMCVIDTGPSLSFIVLYLEAH